MVFERTLYLEEQALNVEEFLTTSMKSQKTFSSGKWGNGSIFRTF